MDAGRGRVVLFKGIEYSQNIQEIKFEPEQHSIIRRGLCCSRRGYILMYVAGYQSIMSNVLGRITVLAYIMEMLHIFICENDVAGCGNITFASLLPNICHVYTKVA